jgi:hypothetical protein
VMKRCDDARRSSRNFAPACIRTPSSVGRTLQQAAIGRSEKEEDCA